MSLEEAAGGSTGAGCGGGGGGGAYTTIKARGTAVLKHKEINKEIEFTVFSRFRRRRKLKVAIQLTRRRKIR